MCVPFYAKPTAMHLTPFSARSAFIDACWCVSTLAWFSYSGIAVILWSLAPRSLPPPWRHSQGHLCWVKHLAFGFPCLPCICLWLLGLPPFPVRGQTRQTIPVAAWVSTDLRDFGCQEVAEGAPAAGTGTTWCVWRTFRSDKDSWWGCQSHKNNWIAPAQQSLQQEFQLYRIDWFRKTFQINRRLLKRCLKFVLGCFGAFFFPVKKKKKKKIASVCECARAHMWFLPDPPPSQGYLSCQYCSERTLLTSKTGSRKVRNKN